MCLSSTNLHACLRENDTESTKTNGVTLDNENMIYFRHQKPVFSLKSQPKHFTPRVCPVTIFPLLTAMRNMCQCNVLNSTHRLCQQCSLDCCWKIQTKHLAVSEENLKPTYQLHITNFKHICVQNICIRPMHSNG